MRKYRTLGQQQMLMFSFLATLSAGYSLRRAAALEGQWKVGEFDDMLLLQLEHKVIRTARQPAAALPTNRSLLDLLKVTKSGGGEILKQKSELQVGQKVDETKLKALHRDEDDSFITGHSDLQAFGHEVALLQQGVALQKVETNSSVETDSSVEPSEVQGTAQPQHWTLAVLLLAQQSARAAHKSISAFYRGEDRDDSFSVISLVVAALIAWAFILAIVNWVGFHSPGQAMPPPGAQPQVRRSPTSRNAIHEVAEEALQRRKEKGGACC